MIQHPLRTLVLALVLTLGLGVLVLAGLRSSGEASAVPGLTFLPGPSEPAVDDAARSEGDLEDRTVDIDAHEPAVARLDPALRKAVRAAAAAAAAEGVEVRINSGWRSRTYQERLFDRALVKYGSQEEALRWVATPETSSHVTGDAVDVAPTDAAYWMSQHGDRFGLCQAYANEIWHYELLTEPGGTCPDAQVR